MAAVERIHGLENNGAIYMHYRQQHFTWHRNNSPDYNFSGVYNYYVGLTRRRYQQMAAESRPTRIERIKDSTKRKIDIFKAIDTFSESNIKANLGIVIEEVQKIGNSAAQIAQESYSLPADIGRVQLNLDRIESVVNNIEKISEDLLYYIQQENPIKQDMRILGRNLFLIENKEIDAFQELRNSILSLKSLLRTSGSDNRKISFLLTALARDIKKVVEDMVHSIAYQVANERIKEKTSVTRGNVRVTVDTFPIMQLTTFQTDNIQAGYKGDGTGRFTFDISYGNVKDKKRFYFNPFGENSLNVNPYLNQLNWQAKYLMYNSLLFHMPYSKQNSYNRYAASFFIKETIDRRQGELNNTFVRIDNDTILPLSSVFSAFASLRTAQPMFSFDNHHLDRSNIWVGKGESIGTDDQDEIRPIFAWVRARRLNSAILRIRATVIFPRGKERASRPRTQA